MASPFGPLRGWLGRAPALRALHYRDFRLLWVGSFFSFTGSMVQNVAQGYLVYDLTRSEQKLALVSFAMSLPVSFFGPFGGFVADLFDRRWALVAAMAASALGPIWLAYATWSGRLEYWHFLAAAVLMGFVQCVELPVRQSIVRAVVSPQDLSAAIPAQASTFNLARIVGPVIGGLLAAAFGAAVCFVVNAASYIALAVAPFLMKADLRPPPRRKEPVMDVILEGMRYTFREPSLRLLFWMEAATSVFGTFYIALMPAIAKSRLGLDQAGLGVALSCIGCGALAGLVLVASMSQRPYKALFAHSAMTVMALGLGSLALVRSTALAFLLLGLVGMATIVQFNQTNLLFQLIAPEALKGRVLSMHVWAISGLAPIGTLLFGGVAEAQGLQAALGSGAVCLLVASLWAWRHWGTVKEPVFD